MKDAQNSSFILLNKHWNSIIIQSITIVILQNIIGVVSFEILAYFVTAMSSLLLYRFSVVSYYKNNKKQGYISKPKKAQEQYVKLAGLNI